VSYNAIVVKIYNAAGSLVHFENINVLIYLEKRYRQLLPLPLYLVVVNSEVVGLVPELQTTPSQMRRWFNGTSPIFVGKVMRPGFEQTAHQKP
jgi:hypothetical protein